MIIRSASDGDIVPMLVMGDFMEGEFVLNEMLHGKKASSSLGGLAPRDFTIKEHALIVLDVGGFALIGAGSEVFTFCSQRFRVLRAKIDYLIETLTDELLDERVTGFYRIRLRPASGRNSDQSNLYLPVEVRDGLVRRLQRLAVEYNLDEAAGRLVAPDCGACEREMVRESPPLGAFFWACEKCGRKINSRRR